MKSISHNTWGLLHGLHASKGVRASTPPAIWTFESIAESGEALAIPHLSDFLLHPSNEVRDAAAGAICKLMATLKPLEYAQLDEAARDVWSSDYRMTASSWRNLPPSGVKQLAHFLGSTHLIGLASFHNSGYVRAAAVEELSTVSTGSEIPFLLVRLNDWTNEVRQLAASAIQPRLQPAYTISFFHNLPLVMRLKGCGRESHDAIVGKVLSLLKEPGATDLLKEGIASKDRWLRRESFRLVAETKTAGSTEILKKVLEDEDPILRLWAAKNILRALSDHELRQTLPQLLQDPFMGVRAEALTIFAERFPSESVEILKKSLLDSHESVRALARFYLQQQNANIDYAAFYRAHIIAESPRELRPAILGLGETGTRDDCAILFPFLTHPVVGVYKAAIRSLAALDGDKYVDHFLVALADSQPGVSNEGTKALRSRAGQLDTDFLWRLVQEDPAAHVRKNAFLLLTSLPFWQRGYFIIQALGLNDPIIANTASRAFNDWLTPSRSVSFPPTIRELEQLYAAIELNKSHISEPILKELYFWLETYN